MCHNLKKTFLNIISLSKKFFHTLITKSKTMFCKTCDYFRSKKFLLFVILYNILFLCSTIHLFCVKNTISVPFVVGVPLISVALLVAWYSKDLVDWSNDRSNKIKKSFSFSMKIAGFLLPIVCIFSSYKLAELYFKENIAKYEMFLWWFLLILQLVFVAFYCCELIDINKPNYDTKHKVLTFTFIIIHIIQLFANIYLLLLAFDPNSLHTINANTPLQLCFDVIYFSAMTFVGGNPNLAPCTRLTQAVVLAESIQFAIYISIIIFNLISAGKDSKENQ